MVNESSQAVVAEVMQKVNQAWLEGRLEDLAAMVHPEIVMVTPGFTGRIEGQEAFLSGFQDFCQNALIQEFDETDHQIDLIGETAVITFRYQMHYDYAGERFRATGRDLWVFQKQGEAWLAVWRTMLDVDEKAA